MLPKIKPCPFCGGKAVAEQESATLRHVRCTKCGARSAPIMMPDHFPRSLKKFTGDVLWNKLWAIMDAYAIKLWNTRQ